MTRTRPVAENFAAATVIGRIGDYRVLYAVNDEEKVVFVFRSGIESKFTGEKRRR